MHRRQFIASLATLTVASSFASAQTPTGSPRSAPAFVPFKIDGLPVALSPDGSMIAGIDPDNGITIWSTASGKVLVRSKSTPENVDVTSLVWAPDSNALAFGLLAVQMFLASSIFVVDINDGSITNVSAESSADASRPLGEATADAPANIDIYPAWSPDGSHIAFSRSIYPGNPDEGTGTICRIPREGGKVVDSITLPQTGMLNVLPWLHWVNGNSVLYSRSGTDAPSALNGVFRASFDDQHVEPVCSGLLASEIPSPLLVDVSPDASMASILTAGNAKTTSASESPRWYYYLLDIQSRIPARYEDVLSLPVDSQAALDAGLFLDGPPTILLDEGDEPVFWYNTVGRNDFHIRMQHKGTDAVTLASFPLPDMTEDISNPQLLYSGIQIAQNGTILVTRPGGSWISLQEA